MNTFLESLGVAAIIVILAAASIPGVNQAIQMSVQAIHEVHATNAVQNTTIADLIKEMK